MLSSLARRIQGAMTAIFEAPPAAGSEVPVPAHLVDHDNGRFVILGEKNPEDRPRPPVVPVLEVAEYGGWPDGFGWRIAPTRCPQVVTDWKALAPESLHATWEKHTGEERKFREHLADLGPTKVEAVKLARGREEQRQMADITGTSHLMPKRLTVAETESRWDALETLLEANAITLYDQLRPMVPGLIAVLEEKAAQLDGALAAIYAEAGVSCPSGGEAPFAFWWRAAFLKRRLSEAEMLLRKPGYPKPRACAQTISLLGLSEYI